MDYVGCVDRSGFNGRHNGGERRKSGGGRDAENSGKCPLYFFENADDMVTAVPLLPVAGLWDI